MFKKINPDEWEKINHEINICVIFFNLQRELLFAIN